MAIYTVDDWGLCAQAEIPVTLGIMGGWSDPLAETSVCLEPSEIIIAGWKQVASQSVCLEPSEVIIAGWKRVAQTTVDLLLPTIECSTDEDCPEGYVCENGVCVKKEGAFPWTWLMIGGAAAGVILIASGIAKKRKSRAI